MYIHSNFDLYDKFDHLKGAGGGLFEISLEIDFISVSYKGELYLFATFGPMEKYCS